MASSASKIAVRRILRLRSASSIAAPIELLHLGRNFEAVVRRRRAQRPLEPLRHAVVPDLVGRLHTATAADRLQDDDQEQDLREAEAEGADRRHHVPISKLRAVVGDAAWHAREPRSEERRVGNEVYNTWMPT